MTHAASGAAATPPVSMAMTIDASTPSPPSAPMREPAEMAATATSGMRLLKKNPPAVVLLDLQLPDADGMHMLEQITADHPDTQVIILTGHYSINNAVESIKRGAYHFITKPYAPEELLSLIEKAEAAA